MELLNDVLSESLPLHKGALSNRHFQKVPQTYANQGFSRFLKDQKHCEYVIVTEQKARVTYDNILRLCDDPDVRDPIKYLREREIVHYQRFGDALRITQEHLDSKNFYAINPAFDKKVNPRKK